MAGRFSGRRLKGLELGGCQYSLEIYAPASRKSKHNNKSKQSGTTRKGRWTSFSWLSLEIAFP